MVVRTDAELGAGSLKYGGELRLCGRTQFLHKLLANCEGGLTKHLHIPMHMWPLTCRGSVRSGFGVSTEKEEGQLFVAKEEKRKRELISAALDPGSRGLPVPFALGSVDSWLQFQNFQNKHFGQTDGITSHHQSQQVFDASAPNADCTASKQYQWQAAHVFFNHVNYVIDEFLDADPTTAQLDMNPQLYQPEPVGGYRLPGPEKYVEQKIAHAHQLYNDGVVSTNVVVREEALLF
jgi:hypothetical protein